VTPSAKAFVPSVSGWDVDGRWMGRGLDVDTASAASVRGVPDQKLTVRTPL